MDTVARGAILEPTGGPAARVDRDAADDVTTVERIDHVALEVRDFDDTIARLEGALGMHCVRVSTSMRDPSRRIAMVRDRAGFALEIIEAPSWHRGPPILDHVAFRVADVDDSYRALHGTGYTSQMTPRRIEAAQADTAVLADQGGLVVQVVRYDPDSPDR